MKLHIATINIDDVNLVVKELKNQKVRFEVTNASNVLIDCMTNNTPNEITLMFYEEADFIKLNKIVKDNNLLVKTK